MKEIFRKTVEEWLERNAESANCLEGAEIWLAYPPDEQWAQIGEAVASVLTHLGAEVACSLNCTDPLEDGLDRIRLHNSESIIMLASTHDLSSESLEYCHEIGPNKDKLVDRMYVLLPDALPANFVRKRLNKHRVRMDDQAVKEFETGKVCKAVVDYALKLRKRSRRMIADASNNFNPTIGIVVALECEYKAAKQILSDPLPEVRRSTPFREYIPGYINAYGGGRHKVVLTVSGMGNNKATAKAAHLYRDFPTVNDIIMVGIAGGVPGLKEGQQDIRLGDVVITNADGVVQTDLGKVTSRGYEHKPPLRPASHDWTALAQSLLAKNTPVDGYWQYVDEICEKTGCSRPSPSDDILCDSPKGGTEPETPRIKDPHRVEARPLTFIGSIGSGNTVVKKAKDRERLRKKLSVIAIEMEGSGIAEASWQGTKGYFVVRGICDYANDGKKKTWQPYASAAAAAFVRYLIENMPATDSSA